MQSAVLETRSARGSVLFSGVETEKRGDPKTASSARDNGDFDGARGGRCVSRSRLRKGSRSAEPGACRGGGHAGTFQMGGEQPTLGLTAA